MTKYQSQSVSIIIPNYNGAALLPKHLPNVISAAKDAEIIIVDDASSDESIEYLHAHYPQIKVIQLPTNQRFAAACNAGVAAAKGEIIILLNSDVSPKPDFLSPLMKAFEDPLVFAAGCREEQSIEGKTIYSGRAGGKFHRGIFVHWRSKDQYQQSTLWVSGGSGAFRKQMWNQLSGLDPLFKPAYEEDRDICYRALKRGWKVQFCPNSEVVHQHETTNTTTLGKAVMSESGHKNNLVFIWKNITSPLLIFQHILWLPYHLLFDSVKTQGAFLKGFFKALLQLPQILQKRQIEKLESTVKDEDIIHQAARLI